MKLDYYQDLRDNGIANREAAYSKITVQIRGVIKKFVDWCSEIIKLCLQICREYKTTNVLSVVKI